MRGSKVDTSHGHVILVHDFLRDFGLDPLRYYIAAAGPENQDTDFTWDEFVRRNNNELANDWGNLDNRCINMAWKNCGAIPEADELTEVDAQLLTAVSDAFTTVGDLLGQCKFKAAITAAMHAVALTNKYVSEQEPWKLKDDPARRDTVLHVALQAVWDCNTILTPFLPHSAQKVYEMLGGSGIWSGMPEIVMVDDEDGRRYPVLMGDYRGDAAVWESQPIKPGTPLEKPTPLFKKLDESLGETGPEWAPLS